MDAKTQLVEVHSNLEKLLKDKSRALPKNFNATRFLQNAITVLADTPDIANIQSKSIARTMLKGAFLGLDFFNKECYAIPYRKNVGTKQAPNYIKELQFQTDYKGEIKLAKKYSLKKIHDIYAKLVRKGDFFEESIVNGQQVINFKPIPFNDKEILGAFAVCLYEDNSMIYDSMTTIEIDKVRKTYSKVPDSKAWKDSWGEMAKKSVLRRLCKLIEWDFESTEQAEAFEEAGDSQFDDITDLEPIQMPKAIEGKQPEPDPLQPNVLPPDEEPAEESMPEPEEELNPPAKSIKDVVGNGGGMFDLEGQQIIASLRSYCKVKGMSLDQISRFHLKKPVEKLILEEIKKLEAVTKEEGRKIK